MKEGTPVIWLFVTFILVAYIGSYIWDIQMESEKLRNIAIEQKQIIEEQKEELKQLSALTETMFNYIYILEGAKGFNNIPRNNSPIHNKPL